MVSDFYFDAPEHVKDIKDVKAIYDIADDVNTLERAEDIHSDMFIKTATEHGIELYEEEYEITPLGTDTLEDRRNRILFVKNDFIPFTERSLRRKLDAMCGTRNGESQYVLTIDVLNQHVECRIKIPRKRFVEQIAEMLEEMVPLNMTLNVETLYNSHEWIKENFHHEDLRDYPATHRMIKE